MPQHNHTLINALRISLGLVFFWFGALKIIGYNPVYEIVYASFPFLASGTGNVILGAVETLIGAGLLLNVFTLVTHSALILHLLGTFSVFLLGSDLMFNPYFPVLTLSGEFVFKNAVLVVAGLVVLGHKRRG